MKLTGGVPNTWYDQLAFDMSVVAGNIVIGAYSDSSSLPSTKYSQTVSGAYNNTFAYESCPDFELLQTVLWIATNTDNVGTTHRTQAGVVTAYAKADTYNATMPTPVSGGSIGGSKRHVKAKHS